MFKETCSTISDGTDSRLVEMLLALSCLDGRVQYSFSILFVIVDPSSLKPIEL